MKNDDISMEFINALTQKLNAVKALESRAPEVGQKMADGTFYLGQFASKDGAQKDWFAAAEDAKDDNGNRLSLSFNGAAEYAKNSKAHGHDDWGVPPSKEPDILNELFNNKAKIGGFDETDSDSSGYYWSSTFKYDKFTRYQCLSDGCRYFTEKTLGLSLRLVRSVAL
jgi:hypothetical protein